MERASSSVDRFDADRSEASVAPLVDRHGERGWYRMEEAREEDEDMRGCAAFQADVGGNGRRWIVNHWFPFVLAGRFNDQLIYFVAGDR